MERAQIPVFILPSQLVTEGATASTLHSALRRSLWVLQGAWKGDGNSLVSQWFYSGTCHMLSHDWGGRITFTLKNVVYVLSLTRSGVSDEIQYLTTSYSCPSFLSLGDYWKPLLPFQPSFLYYVVWSLPTKSLTIFLVSSFGSHENNIPIFPFVSICSMLYNVLAV